MGRLEDIEDLGDLEDLFFGRRIVERIVVQSGILKVLFQMGVEFNSFDMGW